MGETNKNTASSFRQVLRTSPMDFWRLWYVGFVVTTVRWLETVAMGIVVYQQTGSALVVAMITMLRMVPMGLFGAFLGAFAERFDRRLTLAGIVGLMMVTSALLSVVAFRGALEVWHLAVASFINGCGWATDNPLRRVMMGEVMGRDRMAIAMALDVGAGNVSRMVGPAVGGLLLAGVGIEGAFLLGVTMYASAVAATLMVQSHIPSSPGAGAVLARTWEGVTLIFSDRRLGAIMAVTVIYNVFAWPFTSMIPVIGTDRLLLGPEGVGLLTSIDGVGAFAGCLLLALWLTPGWHARAYVGGTAAYLVGLIGFAAAPTPLLAGLALLVTGLAGATFATLQATLVYLAAPMEMRSRILGVLSVCIGTGPIGFVWLGWLADLIGAPEATAITGLMGLLALVATWPLWRRI
ncbi:MFS transporter [uncultured Reyranella sp.]|uniref:MFS transporter n=1 Tax=uncultured Reyranella sp. TaxID=735512 RepID=UPI0025DE5456|nr:MFS transporter [uncultured Reyranella sp.]